MILEKHSVIWRLAPSNNIRILSDFIVSMQKRSIKSYVLRQGRLTSGQKRALDELFPKYGVSLTKAPCDFKTIFKREAPVVCEIGFGDGASLAEIACLNPDINYLGIEVHTPGVGRLLKTIEREKIENLRLINHDAVEVLSRYVADESLAGVHLFFPDPWPKARHHKRRILNKKFINLIAKKLIPGGFFYLATDWQNYAEQMMEVLSQTKAFKNQFGKGQFAPDRCGRPKTKFEQRGNRLGHDVWDLRFIRTR